MRTRMVAEGVKGTAHMVMAPVRNTGDEGGTQVQSGISWRAGADLHRR